MKSTCNSDHYHLQEWLVAIITAAFAVKFEICSYRDNYEKQFMKEDELFLQSVAYADTRTIEEKDAFRDERLRDVDLKIQSGLLSLVIAEEDTMKTLDFVVLIPKLLPI